MHPYPFFGPFKLVVVDIEPPIDDAAVDKILTTIIVIVTLWLYEPFQFLRPLYSTY